MWLPKKNVKDKKAPCEQVASKSPIYDLIDFRSIILFNVTEKNTGPWRVAWEKWGLFHKGGGTTAPAKGDRRRHAKAKGSLNRVRDDLFKATLRGVRLLVALEEANTRHQFGTIRAKEPFFGG